MVIAKVLVLCVYIATIFLSEGSDDVRISDPVVTGRVNCETTKGLIEMEIYREWSPIGADHFLDLVKAGFYHDVAMYRCVDNFLTQFGISENPVFSHLHGQQIVDDENLGIPITRGLLSYAGGGPNTRSTQLFIAFATLDFLGKEPWETPFGKVVKGFDVLDALYKGYGDISPFNKDGPDQRQIYQQGNKYIHDNFPNIDFVKHCFVVDDEIDLRRELTSAPNLMDSPPSISMTNEEQEAAEAAQRVEEVSTFLRDGKKSDGYAYASMMNNMPTFEELVEDYGLTAGIIAAVMLVVMFAKNYMLSKTMDSKSL
jgi:peptidyl-prolyl cis-trans isomerase A (cyclophilin A)